MRACGARSSTKTCTSRPTSRSVTTRKRTSGVSSSATGSSSCRRATTSPTRARCARPEGTALMGLFAHLAALLHMRQPLYVDPRSGVAQLPWVRLHAVRGYADLAAKLEEFGDVRMNINFVPSLMDQLAAVAAGVPGSLDAWTAHALSDIV